MTKFILMLFLCTFMSHAGAKCVGKMINPITDVCWSCLFPLTIGPVKVNNGGDLVDTPNPRGPLCLCPKPPSPVPIPGIPIGFWEPVRLIDVTRTPYCMVSLGGISIAHSMTQGTHGVTNAKAGFEASFYQMHWYIYPLIYWLELLVDFLCLEKAQFDVAYLTELDPLWNDDEMSLILNPEAVLFANPLAQASCAADCAAASVGLPLDALFWCGGCQGSLYPFTGTVEAHAGGVQASLLLSERMIAKLHRSLLLWGTSGEEGLCQRYLMPVIKKSQYKLQMTFPVPATQKALGCHPLGRTSVFLESGREFPINGEDFSYLLWRKRSCCLL